MQAIDFFCRNDVQAIDFLRKGSYVPVWYRIKTTDGNYKYDIDSIMNEQVDFYIKLFQSEGWDENSAHELTNKQTNKYFIIPRHYTVYKGSKHQTNT